MPNEDKPIEIDLRRKETEAGWISIFDRFGLQVAPIWFNWLGWILILGALHFLYDQSNSIVIAITIGFSYCLLWLFFCGFFYRLEFKGFPILSTPKANRFASIVLSGFLASFAWWVAQFVALAIARFQHPS